MLQVILKKIDRFYAGGNRWWLPLLCGLLYALPHPPFNSLLHPVFTIMPLAAPLALIPLFYFATRQKRRRALFHSYLFCAAMMFGQCYWIGFVAYEGMWIYVIIGVVLISFILGAYYFISALLFRYLSRRLPCMYIAVFPAAWVLMEYGRAFTDLAFPWSLVGYSSVGILPIAQFSAFTGVWGLSYLIVIGSVIIWELLRAVKRQENVSQKWAAFGGWVALTVGIFVWGLFRMNADDGKDTPVSRVALVQSYMDQFNWTFNSLDSAITISDSMVTVAAIENPEVMIFPESAVLCYILDRSRRSTYARDAVLSWVRRTNTPIVFGTLHAERDPHSDQKVNTYNSALMAKDGAFKLYHKMALVPFSERMPFEAEFPILSRVNVGGAGFARGTEETLYRINDKLIGAPLICYEIIFPQHVRRRLTEPHEPPRPHEPPINIIVNVTNDGWFGRSSGPYQHAAMSQMRSIENGITLARSANSGISMFVDPYGRVLSRTGLYTREILIDDVPTYRVNTFYTQYGDWFVWLCAAMVAAGIIMCATNKRRMGEITNPLLVEEQGLAAAKP